MILYVDTFISETPLAPLKKLEAFLEAVQSHSYTYRKQSKIDIFKYSLASYVPIPWTHVILRIDGELREEIEKLRPFLMECFPGADLVFERCNTGTKYAKVLEKYRDGNPWVFFSPNNDHPFIYKDPNVFQKLIEAAELTEKKQNLPVMILFSHFTESINSISPSRFLYGFTGDFCQIVDEDPFSYTVKYNHIGLLSLQIFRLNHLLEMMKMAGDNKVIRPENLGAYIEYNKDSILIVPKMELCRHYDGYMHTSFFVRDYISAARVPPLFIPDGFFEKTMRIRFGYDDYLNGWVNINPKFDRYIFESKTEGTDLGMSLDDLPYFWRSRTAQIDLNPEFQEGTPGQAVLWKKIENPWSHYSKTSIFLINAYRFLHFKILVHFPILQTVKTSLIKAVKKMLSLARA